MGLILEYTKRNAAQPEKKLLSCLASSSTLRKTSRSVIFIMQPWSTTLFWETYEKEKKRNLHNLNIPADRGPLGRLLIPLDQLGPVKEIHVV